MFLTCAAQIAHSTAKISIIYTLRTKGTQVQSVSALLSLHVQEKWNSLLKNLPNICTFSTLNKWFPSSSCACHMLSFLLLVWHPCNFHRVTGWMTLEGTPGDVVQHPAQARAAAACCSGLCTVRF